MKLSMYFDRILVKKVEQDNITESGILLPESSTDRINLGEVVEVGFGKRNSEGDIIPLKTFVGEKIIFGKYSGMTIETRDGKFIVMREEDVIATIDDFGLVK